MSAKILNIAHRGASRAFPENTVSAFRAACDAGADMCELDVHLSRDGHLMVIHDDTVDRTTSGRGAVADMALAELRALHIGPGERIPTLDEVFDATAGLCSLNLELKAAGAETRVADMIRERGASDSAMVSSFDWDALAATRRIAPEIRLGVLAEKNPPLMIAEAERLGAYAVNPRFDMVTSELCADAHARGFKLLVWTVDVPEIMRMMVQMGVDGIMTNCPERLREVLGQ